jgi:hypothetical protein
VLLGCTAADGSQSWAFGGLRSRERAHLPHLVAESAVQRVVQSKRAEGRGTRSWQDQCRLLHIAPTPCRLKHASHHMNAPNSVYTRDSSSRNDCPSCANCCAPAVSRPAVASGGTFQVNCPGPFTGSFPVTLTAESGDPDCEGSGTASSTVTVNTRPTLDVTRQSVDEEFCETRQEATYSFTVAAPDLAPGALIELAIPSNCEFTTPTGLTESSSTCKYCDMVSAPATLASLWQTRLHATPTPPMTLRGSRPCLGCHEWPGDLMYDVIDAMPAILQP